VVSSIAIAISTAHSCNPITVLAGCAEVIAFPARTSDRIAARMVIALAQER
jgi:hypothetical protein